MTLFTVAVALCMQQSSPAGAPTAPPVQATPPVQVAPPAAPALEAKWPRKDSEASEDIAGVVKKGTPIYKWSEGHNFTEGPACAPDGTVYFVDIPANEILRLDPMGAKSISTKSNATFGLYLAKDGTLYGAQASPGAITKIDPASGSISVVCDKRARPDEKTGPALTAPVLGRRREGAPPDAVYFVGKGASEAVEVISDAKLRGPNGINLSADGKTLYVVPYLSLTIMAYPIEGPGKLGAGASSTRSRRARARRSAATASPSTTRATCMWRCRRARRSS